MKQQAFQPGELRDENNNIIREGVYGKKTPFTNAENMGILDYLINNLDVLHNGLLINGISFDDDGTPHLSPEVAQAMENIKAATEAAKDVAITARDAANKSAQAAADSASSAFTAASNASTSESNAAQSASAAATSATNAAGSASTASSKASAAGTSATNAAKSATEAKSSAAQANSLVSKAAYGFLQRNTAYAVGDIAYCEQLPAGYYLECVTAGTTGNTEPTFKAGGVKVLDGSVEWNVALVASSAAVENVNSELSDKLSSLLIETGIVRFDNIPAGGGATQEVYFSQKFPVESFGIVATLNSWAAYWAGINISIVVKTSTSFTLALWNNDGVNEVNNIYVAWQAIYDGRN